MREKLIIPDDILMPDAIIENLQIEDRWVEDDELQEEV